MDYVQTEVLNRLGKLPSGDIEAPVYFIFECFYSERLIFHIWLQTEIFINKYFKSPLFRKFCLANA